MGRNLQVPSAEEAHCGVSDVWSGIVMQQYCWGRHVAVVLVRDRTHDLAFTMSWAKPLCSSYNGVGSNGLGSISLRRHYSGLGSRSLYGHCYGWNWNATSTYYYGQGSGTLYFHSYVLWKRTLSSYCNCLGPKPPHRRYNGLGSPPINGYCNSLGSRPLLAVSVV
jgi:hypothetical protein